MSDENAYRQLPPEMPDEPNSSGIFHSARYALGVEYCGSQYCGWQRQDGAAHSASAASIQQCVEEALSHVASQRIVTVCAGRTDSGVHAREQVVHFDTRAARPDKAWVLGVNTHLPDDIRVHWVKRVEADFHARFSATARTYRYCINNQAIRPALSRGLATFIWKPLDSEAMHRAAQYLLGENDFSSFRGSSCQSKTPYRYVHHITVCRAGSLVIVEIKANAFLHHMVRNIVGVLTRIGAGEKPESWAKEVLVARDRCAAGVTAPPDGLYLVQVDYPPAFQLPQRSLKPLNGRGDFEAIFAGDIC